MLANNADAGGMVDPERIAAVVRCALAEEGVPAAELSVTLLGDTAIAEMNGRYLAHPVPTDVISFALHGPGEPPLGDVYIGAEQAERQAGEHGVAADQEVLRLAVHGALHVLGWDHPEGEERLSCPMYQRQEQLLAKFLGEERCR